jgi:Tfp pilus assembly protein PilE
VSLELITTLASIGTLLVIAATAFAAFVQLRHLSGSNSITALTESREVLESTEFS